MAAPTAAVGKTGRLTDTASALDPRAKAPTPVAGTMGSRSPVSTPGLGEIDQTSVSSSFLACFQTRGASARDSRANRASPSALRDCASLKRLEIARDKQFFTRGRARIVRYPSYFLI